MAFIFVTTGILQQNWTPFLQVLRFRRINIQKPRPPFYVRAKVLEFVKPQLPKLDVTLWNKPTAVTCKKQEELEHGKTRIVNPYEQLLAKDLYNMFATSKLIAFFHRNPYNTEEKFKMDVAFKKEGMYLKENSKHTVKIAVENTPYETILPLFQSRTVMLFSEEPKVRKLLRMIKKMPSIILICGIVEGKLMSLSQMQEYSQLTDIAMARAQLVSVLNSAQLQLANSLTYHQTSLVLGLEQYAQSQTEKSESQTEKNESPADSSQSSPTTS